MRLDYFLEEILSRWRYLKVKKIIQDKQTILEIGCGAKASFLRSLPEDKKLIGIDPKIREDINQKENLTLIREKAIDRINLSNNSTDCVIMLAVLEHLERPEQIIKEIYRILRPNGLLYLTTPTPFAKRILEFLAFIRLLDREQVAEHKRYFNKKNLKKITREAGFVKVKHKYFQLGCNNLFIAKK